MRALPLPLPNDRWTRALLAPVIVFVAACIDRNYQTDLWHHLARGRILVEQGELADADRFTFTVPGRPFRDVNGGWQASFYLLHRAGGLPLVQVANAAVLALAMALLFRLAARHSGSPVAACAACLFAFFGLWPLILIRPQTFSFLLFTLLLNVLDAAHRRPRLLVVVPVVMAFWVNLHGGFPVGLVLVAAHALAAGVGAVVGNGEGKAESLSPRWAAVARGLWPWAAALAAGLAATLLNPYGWRVYDYVGVTSTSAAGRKIDEWLPPGLDTLTGKVWALSLVAALALSALPRRRPGWRAVLVAGCFLPLACGSVRMVAWWLLALTPVLAERLAVAFPRLKAGDAGDDRPTSGAAVTVAALACAAVLSLPWLERYNPALLAPGRAHRTETDLQAAADRLAAAAPGGRLFTRLAWGEYLGWALAPRTTVFLDGRIEIYPDEVWGQYTALTHGRADWQEILDGYDVDRLLLDSGGYHAQLLPLVERSGRWREEGRFGSAVLFARRGEAAHDGRTAAR